MISVLLGGILFLVVDVVYDRTVAGWSAVASATFLVTMLVVLPARVARHQESGQLD